MFEMCLDGVWKGSSKNSEIKKSVNYSIGGGVFCHTRSNLGISALLEILQSCKLDHEVA